MQQSGYPAQIPVPWASSAASTYVNTIPLAPNSSNPDLASFQQGFPSGTFGATGVPPYGQDFNGILQQITAGLQYVQAGSVPLYNATFASNISGYPKGALLASTTLGSFWVNQVDGNTTNPDNGGSNWLSLFAGLAPLASPSFTGTPLTPTPAAGANNTQIANTAWVTAGFAAINGNASNPFAVSNLTASTGVFSNIQVFTSSGTFTVPNGVTKIRARVWGGGGGGGGSATGGAGGGGCGGGYGEGVFTVTPGQAIAVTVGAGGLPGVENVKNGTAGGTSSVGTLISSTGGAGGFSTTTGSVGANNGPGRSTGGIITIDGVSTIATSVTSGAPNLGLGSAGGGAFGSSSSQPSGGNGGTLGIFPGGGGGGNGASAGFQGGTGAAGLCIVEY